MSHLIKVYAVCANSTTLNELRAHKKRCKTRKEKKKKKKKEEAKECRDCDNQYGTELLSIKRLEKQDDIQTH